MSTFVSELEKKKKGAMSVIQKVPHVLPHREVINSERKFLVIFYEKSRSLNCFRIGFTSSKISIISIYFFSYAFYCTQSPPLIQYEGLHLTNQCKFLYFLDIFSVRFLSPQITVTYASCEKALHMGD